MTNPEEQTASDTRPGAADADAVQRVQASFLRRILANAGALFLGGVGATIIGLAALTLTTRLIGPREFGTLVLISAFAFLVSRLLGFQSWQAVIRFGAEVRDKPEELSLVVTAGLLLDVAAALLSAVIFLLSIPIFAQIYHLGRGETWLAAGFVFAIVTNITGMPIGLLRLFGRFKLLGRQDVAAAAIKLGLLVPAFLLQAGMAEVGIIWIASQLFGQVLLVYFGFREMRRQGIVPSGFQQTWKFLCGQKKLTRFFVISNLDASIRVFRDIDTLVIGAVLSPVAAGFYRIGRQAGGLIAKPTDALFAAIYPELVELKKARSTHLMARVMVRSALFAGILVGSAGIVFLLIGHDVLRIFLGARYVPAYPICVLVLAAQFVWAAAHPLAPAMLALDRQRRMLAIHVFATAIYVGTLFFAGRLWGLVGVGLSLVEFFIIWAGLNFLSVRSALKQTASPKYLK